MPRSRKTSASVTTAEVDPELHPEGDAPAGPANTDALFEDPSLPDVVAELELAADGEPAATDDQMADAPADERPAEDATADLETEPDVEAAPVEALPSLIEALLFVSDGPVEVRSLARALKVSVWTLEPALEELRTRLEGRGLILQTGPEGAQLVTAPQAAQYVEAFLGLEQHRRLSNAALETLAIVAYRQPVTRATIESIRGVSSDGAMQTLRARGLIEEAGRSTSPGRPTLFVTTQRFLEHFGLNGPQDLPELGDIELPAPDTSIPMPGLDGRPSGGASIEAVADELSSLSAAARALADPGQPRPGATALLRPGPTILALPSPASGAASTDEATDPELAEPESAP